MSSFDPLGSTSSIFAEDASIPPPWPTTPHADGVVESSLRRAITPGIIDKGPTPGLYGKEAQIYGAQTEAGLISPRVDSFQTGKSYEMPTPFLRVRITGLDRNRRDILVKFDAQTNLSNFSGNSYRNVSRSYVEFQQFYDAIVHSNPQTIIPALPLAQTSAPTDEEDDRLVKIMLQRWVTRVCEDPIIIHDEDLRAFVESDFGYQPTPRPRRKTSSGFSIIRRGVPDEDEELQRARFDLTKLEGQFFDTAKAIDRLSITRKALATAHAEMGNKLVNVASTEAHPPLGNALRKLGRTWHSVADLDQAQAISECVIVGDSFGYQGMNARSAKETLLQRTGVLEEYQAAVKTTISKRRHIERLKASSNIRADRVDEALEDIEEANKYEQTLARRAEGISQNLHRALETHNRLAQDDLTAALIEHARSTIMYERQLLRELEALRPDVNDAAKKVSPGSIVPPKPTVIPKLEDFSKPPPPKLEPPSKANWTPPAPSARQFASPPSTPSRFAGMSPQQQAAAVSPTGSHFPGGLSQSATFSPTRPSEYMQQPQSSQSQTFTSSRSNQFGPQGPLSAASLQTSFAPSPTTNQFGRGGPLSPASAGGSSSRPHSRGPLPPQSPGAGPSSIAPTPSNEGPLGGQFVSRSMFLPSKPSSNASPLTPDLPISSSSSFIYGQRTPVVANGNGVAAGSSNGASPANGLPQSNGNPLGSNGSSTSNGNPLDPLASNGNYGTGRFSSPLGGDQRNEPVLRNDLDPLGQVITQPMSNSIRGPPPRPRLDAKQAAKSLANMF